MYTGILLRYDSQVNYETDVLVSRELAVSQYGLGIGIDRGSGVEGFWLNYEALSKLSAIAPDGAVTPGFKTSDIPIIYDSGYLEAAAGGLLVDQNLFSLTLSHIHSITADSITFTDKAETPTYRTIDFDSMNTLSRPDVTLSLGVYKTNLPYTILESEFGVILGEGPDTVPVGTVDVPITAEPLKGKKMYYYTVDASLNKSKRGSIIMATELTIDLNASASVVVAGTVTP